MTRRTPKRSSGRVPAPVPAPPPPAWRDPWLWLSAASVLPLLFHSLGAPLGEPVAEDFDFLRHNLLLGRHGLLDGGGSHAFWRPVTHQLYYAALGPWILAHPAWVAAVHVALLALSAALLYRTLRVGWPGPQAAVAASFPFLMESVRTVISWPSHGVELGSLLFTAAALHEASRRRMATCLAALALALLSKEVAVVAALMIPLLPGLDAGEERRAALGVRLRWAAATGALTAVWALAYLAVRGAAHLALPHQLESDAATLAVPLPARLGWAVWNSVRAMFSLPAVTLAGEHWLWIAAGALLVAGAALVAMRAPSRRRLRAEWGWLVWGALWFALASATLTTIFPFWAPNRALFGSVGLGVALAALLGAAGPLLPWGLVLLRVATLEMSPRPSGEVAVAATPTGAFMDFEQLTRLQRLMADTRGALRAGHPSLPRGALVGQHAMPRRAEYAFGGDFALQCWYRDTTLRWVRFDSFVRDTSLAVVTFAEYQLGRVPSIALVETAAMRALLAGVGRMAASDLPGALDWFTRAEDVQRDPRAGVFLGTVAGKRAICAMGLGNLAESVTESRRAIGLYRENPDARYVLAIQSYELGDLDGAEAQLDTLLVLTPGDADAIALREKIRAPRP